MDGPASEDRFSGLPHWFGSRSWCLITDEGTQVDTPVGSPCLFCEDVVGADDYGYIRPYFGTDGGRYVAVHRECDFRVAMGGVECLKRQRDGTHVVGDHEPDPPGLSKREAAQASWDFFDEHRDHWIAQRQ